MSILGGLIHADDSQTGIHGAGIHVKALKSDSLVQDLKALRCVIIAIEPEPETRDQSKGQLWCPAHCV